MADNTAHHPYTVNIGLYTTAVEATGISEGDLWYNEPEGRTKVRLDGRTGIVGPHGTHPIIYGVDNAWHPLTPGGFLNGAVTTANGRAYAYPLNPGRKCFFDRLAFRVQTAGVGNAHAALYTADPTTGLPGPLLSDFGTASVAVTNSTVSAFNLLVGGGVPMEPYRYWLVLAMQTSVAPVCTAYSSASPFVPYPVTTPAFNALGTDMYNCVYTDTGFAGPGVPNPFGTVAGAAQGPFVYVKLSTLG